MALNKYQSMMKETFTPAELGDIALQRLYGLYNIIMAMPDTDETTESLGGILILCELISDFKEGLK